MVAKDTLLTLHAGHFNRKEDYLRTKQGIMKCHYKTRRERYLQVQSIRL